MAILLFPLRHVADDELDDIRDVLNENAIQFYETNAGNWGISMPAIWLPDNTQQQQAQQLIAIYQQERQVVLRSEYAQLKQSGEASTFLSNLRQNPLQVILFIAAIFAVLYTSIKMVLDFGL